MEFANSFVCTRTDKRDGLCRQIDKNKAKKSRQNAQTYVLEKRCLPDLCQT